MNLTYQAVDGSGKRVQDVVEAADIREAAEQLRRRGLFVTDISPATQRDRPTARTNDPATARKLPLKTTLFFTKQMAMLLKAGSGVVPALGAIKPQLAKPAHASLVSSLIADLEEGATLCDAMAKHPQAFDAGYRAIIAAGEASATLPSMFERLTVILGRRRIIRNQIIGSLVYPAFLIVLCVAVLVVLLLFVIPRFAGLFGTLDLDLPASTSFLLGLSEVLQEDWPVLAMVLIGLVVLVAALCLSRRGRIFFTSIQTEVPVLGRLMSRLIQGQLFQTLGMLIECRVGLLDAIELGRGITGNRRFQTLLDDVESSVTSGDQMSSALKRAGFISPTIYHSIHTGEESGNLGPAISFCADSLNEENQELISTITRIIEPMILVVMGFVVGTVAVSLFLPLFDMTAAIG